MLLQPWIDATPSTMKSNKISVQILSETEGKRVNKGRSLRVFSSLSC